MQFSHFHHLKSEPGLQAITFCNLLKLAFAADEKALSVPVTDPRTGPLRDIHDIPEFGRLEIQHSSAVDKELEPGKKVEGAAWADRTAANAGIEAARDRCAKNAR